MILAIIVLILISVIVGVFKFFELEVVQVIGNSMKPTYKNRHLVLITKKYKYVNSKLNNENNCFVYKCPEGFPVIKRLKNTQFCNGEFYYWFEGDNAEVSKDSRQYGFITQDKIIGVLVFHRDNKNKGGI